MKYIKTKHVFISEFFIYYIQDTRRQLDHIPSHHGSNLLGLSAC